MIPLGTRYQNRVHCFFGRNSPKSNKNNPEREALCADALENYPDVNILQKVKLGRIHTNLNDLEPYKHKTHSLKISLIGKISHL